MGYLCDMKSADSGPCGHAAAHQWGNIHFCCPHFSLFVEALYDLNEAVSKRQHSDLVRIYEDHMRQTSKLSETLCMGEPSPLPRLDDPPDAPDE